MLEPNASMGAEVECSSNDEFQRRLAELILAAKEFEPMAPVTVIVDSSHMGVMLRRQLLGRHLLGPSVANVRFLTMNHFVSGLAHDQGMKVTADIPTVVRQAVTSAVMNQYPGAFEAVQEHPSTIVALTDLVDELRWCEVDPLAIHESAPPTTIAALDLVRRVRSELADAYGVASEGEIVKLVQKSLGLQAASLPADQTFIVAASNVPSRIAELFAKLASISRVHFVSIRAAVRAELETVLDCPDPDTEVAIAVREVVGALAHGVRPQEIAILYGAHSIYGPLLEAELTAAGVNWFGRTGSTFSHSPVARALSALLDMAVERSGENSGISRAHLLRLVSCIEAVERSHDWPAADWRYLVGQRHLYGDAREWRPTLVLLLESDGSARRVDSMGDDKESTNMAAGSLLQLIDKLDASLGLLTTATSWAATGTGVWRLVEALFIEVGVHELQSRDVEVVDRLRVLLLDEVSQLDDVTGINASSPKLRVKFVSDVVRRDLSSRGGDIRESNSGIYVGHLSDSIGIHLDTVVIVGLAEGLLPVEGSRTALLPDGVRRALRSDSADLPTETEKIRQLRNAYLSVVTSTRRVITTRPRAGVRGLGKPAPSRFLTPGESSTGRVISSRSSSLLDQTLPYVVTPTDIALVTNVDRGSLPPELVGQLDASIAGARAAFDRFHGKVTESGRQGHPVWEISEEVLSASAIETYLDCPHHFFVRRILGVKTEVGRDEIDVAPKVDVGTMVHAALERLVNHLSDRGALPGEGEPWPEEALGLLRDKFDELVAEAKARGQLGWDPDWRKRYRELVDCFEQLLRVDTPKLRAAPPLRPHAAELRFGGEGQAQVVAMLADGTAVRLTGAIDRYDVESTGGAVGIVDYKTGIPEGFKAKLGFPNKNGVTHRTKVQDLVYAAAARAITPTARVVQIRFVFLTDGGRVEVVTADHEHNRVTALQSQLALLAEAGRTGQFPPKPTDRDSCPVCKLLGRRALGAQESYNALRMSGENHE